MVDKEDNKQLINLVIALGWLSLFLSSTCFYFSTRNLDATSYALWLFIARLFGIGAFVVGGFSLLNQRWTHGTLLFIGSVTLPFVSLFIHGTI